MKKAFLNIIVFSLGCGIGYGYLHRIPTAPFTEGKNMAVKHPSSPPQVGEAAQTPKPVSPDGFSDVSLTRSQW